MARLESDNLCTVMLLTSSSLGYSKEKYYIGTFKVWNQNYPFSYCLTMRQFCVDQSISLAVEFIQENIKKRL